MRVSGEMVAQHDAGVATQPQEEIEDESQDFKPSFCELWKKRVKWRNIEDLSGKQNEGRERVKSHFVSWEDQNNGTEWRQREPTLTTSRCG